MKREMIDITMSSLISDKDTDSAQLPVADDREDTGQVKSPERILPGEKEQVTNINCEGASTVVVEDRDGDETDGRLKSGQSFPPEDAATRKHLSLNSGSNDVEFTSREGGNHETNEDPDALMIGVEIFEETDLDGDADHNDNKLQLYAGAGATAMEEEYSEDALNCETTAEASLSPSEDISAGTIKGKTKLFREPSRLSLEERIKCIRMCSRYNSYADAQKAWRQTYDTEPPCRKTMSTLNKKFQKTGSVADLSRTGRPKTTRTEAVIARVEEAVTQDPSKSIRTLAKELGIHQASVHRIKKEFEDKKNTLKMENKNLRVRLNDALKRIDLLEKRLSIKLLQQQTEGQTDVTTAAMLPVGIEPKYETLVITTPDGNGTNGLATFTSDPMEGHGGSNIPTIIALNNSNNQVLRLPPGQETIHIITLPQSSSHHQVLSLDDSASFQLSIPSNSPTGQVGNISTSNFLATSTSVSSNNQDTVHTSFVSFK